MIKIFKGMKIRRFSIHFSLSEAKKKKKKEKEINTLEDKTKTFEDNLTNNESNKDCLQCKRDFTLYL